MNHETHDSDTNPFDSDYSAFVDWLSQITTSELREVKGELDKEKQALYWYYARGERTNLTPFELFDFLGVSASSILDRAGYSEKEGNDLMQISDRLTEEDKNAYRNLTF